MNIKNALRGFVLFVSSYGVSMVLLFLLLVLTFFGTLEQVNIGLHEAQKKYFESYFLVHNLGGIPIPLPGAYLVMALLFVNLLFGGILRARKEWRRPGMIIAHAGMLLMLLAGAVTYHYSDSGHLTLYEGERSNEFQSYYAWEICIAQPGTDTQLIIPGEQFAHLGPEEQKSFFAQGLPFELRLSGYQPNCEPASAPGSPDAVDGMVLAGRPLAKDAERNLAGAYVDVVEEGSDAVQRGLLWGMAQAPWQVQAGGSNWTIDLRRKRWPLPFTIVLDKFHRDLHPGTAMAANFSSDVTKIDEGVSRQVEIKMNEPLRHKGYTLFQSGWGPQNAPEGAKLFSTFSVVRNPADQWPLYSCYIVTLGLCIHFLQRLVGHIRQQNRRAS